jgi:hypothetical protein
MAFDFEASEAANHRPVLLALPGLAVPDGYDNVMRLRRIR